MNKKMREIWAKISHKAKEAQGYMEEGESKDLSKAEALLNEIDELQKEYDLEARLEARNKDKAGDAVPAADGKADGFKTLSNMVNHQRLSESEKDLLYPGSSGESYLVPDDVRLEINELRKTYRSAKEIVTVLPTDALTGSFNFESGTPAGLSELTDGNAISTETNLAFIKKSYTIAHYAKLIPISRILAGAEKAGLMGYLNSWFLKNAVISENAKIFTVLKNGYNSGTPKEISGWSGLKKSINEDLDPSCLFNGVIATNQSGFAALDEEVDGNGRPVLQPNPAEPTKKLFQGLPVVVFPDAQLANIDATHFPMLYGDTKAGAYFLEYANLEFAVSSEYLFNKNQDCLRVIEGFDTINADTSAYIYGSFTPTV